MSGQTATDSRSADIPTAFRVFAVVSAVSVFGDYLNYIAFSLFTFQLTRSAVVTGVVLALRLIGGFAFARCAGIMATSGSRRQIMVISDGVQAAFMVALALAVHLKTAATIGLFPASLAIGACSTASNVALRSAIPVMVGSERRTKANAFMSGARSTAMAVGFASASVLVQSGGFRLAFLINAASFGASVFAVMTLPLMMQEPTSPSSAAASPEPESALPLPGRRSWRTRRRPPMAPLAMTATYLILIRGADAFGSGSHNVGLPVFFSLTHPNHAATYLGLFWCVWAVGGLAAASVVSRFAGQSSDPGMRAFVLGTCVMSASFIAAFLRDPLFVLLPIAFVAGASDGFTEISYTTAMQDAPDAQRGYLFGLSSVAERAGLGGGMIVAGLLIGAIGTLTTAIILHGIAITLAVTFLIRSAMTRQDRQILPAIGVHESPRPEIEQETIES